LCVVLKVFKEIIIPSTRVSFCKKSLLKEHSELRQFGSKIEEERSFILNLVILDQGKYKVFAIFTIKSVTLNRFKKKT